MHAHDSSREAKRAWTYNSVHAPTQRSEAKMDFFPPLFCIDPIDTKNNTLYL